MKVLIAEDDERVRRLLHEILDELHEDETGNGEARADEPWDVTECANGLEAVAAARRSRPDLVLMDIRMPRLDGIEATRRITEMDRSIRVLIVTQLTGETYRQQARRAGAAGYFLKDDLYALQHFLRGLREETRTN